METRGNKYQAGRTGPEIAKLIRAEIRTACKTEGNALFGCKVSVRFEWATHSKSIVVTIVDAPQNMLNAERVRAVAKDPHAYRTDARYNATGEAMIAECGRIVGQFNRDNSDRQTDYFDVEFYFSQAHVAFDLEDKQRAAILAAEKHPACCGCADCEAAFAA